MLKSESTGRYADWFREHLSTCRPHKELYLLYLVGSAAVSGKVDEAALAVLHGLYRAKEDEYLLDLLSVLKEENTHDAVARFISRSIYNRKHANFPKFLVIELMVKQWTAMKALAIKVLDILKYNYNCQCNTYRFMLAMLSMDRQSEIAASAQNYGRVREKLMHEYVSKRTEAPPLFDIVGWNAAIWQNIIRLLDVATLFRSLPLVCRSWRTMIYPMILAHDAGLHNSYLQTSSSTQPRQFADVPQWKSYLVDTGYADNYLWWCIMNDALIGFELDYKLGAYVMRHLKMMARDQSIPLRIENCTPCDSFLMLFEKAYKSCAGSKPDFDRPGFFTDEEYERAVRHLVLDEQHILKLCPILMADLVRLFAVIRENEGLMIKLIKLNFGSLQDPSLIQIIHRQARNLPEKLKTLILTETKSLAELAEQERTAPPSGYYASLVKSDEIFYEQVGRKYFAKQFHPFITSLILYFKSDRAKIDWIVENICKHHPDYCRQDVGLARAALGNSILTVMNASDNYTSEEIKFVLENMLKLPYDP